MLTEDGKFRVKEKDYLYKEELMAFLISYIEVVYEPKPLAEFRTSVFQLVRNLVNDIATNEKAVEKFFIKVLTGADEPIPLPKAAAPKAKAAAPKAAAPKAKPKAKAAAMDIS